MQLRYSILFIACLSTLLTACASTGEGEDTDPGGAELLLDLSQFDEDEGEFCIPLARINSMKILGDQAIEFRMKGGESYINILPNKCPGLRPNRTIMYETRQSQLCHVDIIRVMEQFSSGMQPIVSCGLGRFHIVPAGAPVVGGEEED